MSQHWKAGKVEHWPTKKLIPYARNSRTHSDAQVAQIASSIDEFGFVNPILTGSDGVIIAGHGRFAAAQKLGLAEVPVIILDHLTPTQRRALIIADNRIAENAGWDEAMLALELQDLRADEFDISLIGFDPGEIDALLGDGGTEGQSDPDDVPDPLPTPVSKHGDVWICGKHRVMCGDSTSVEDVAKLCAGVLVDMWLTDPPYNVAYEGGTKDKLTIQNDDMDDGQFRAFLVGAYKAADSAMRPGATFYIWHADSEGFNFRGAAADIGWTVRQCLIWKKSSLVLGRQDYQWMHEPCLYGWKDGAAHKWTSDRTQTTILEFDKPSRNGEHPTMKPVELFEYQLLNNTNSGDAVLDSFGGSGTTLIAAEKNGRVARTMELDPRYCDVIVRRWQTFSGGTAVLESTGDAFPEDE